MPVKNNALSENSKENLDRKLDHAVEETFPTSARWCRSWSSPTSGARDGSGCPAMAPSPDKSPIGGSQAWGRFG